jgi:hypothetical protein
MYHVHINIGLKLALLAFYVRHAFLHFVIGNYEIDVENVGFFSTVGRFS